MVGEWPETSLGQHFHVKHGFAYKGEYFRDGDVGDVLITPGNFRIGGGFTDARLKRYVGPSMHDYVLPAGEIVVTMTDLSKGGDTLGYAAKVPSDGQRYLHNQRIGRLVQRAEAKVTLDFAHWLMRTPPYRHHVLGAATGSTVKHTSPSRIEQFVFLLPPPRVQQEVCELLGSLDDKIELNRRMAATLEATARALFKSWFVDFDPVCAKTEGRPTGLPDDLAALFPDRLTDDGLPEGWRATNNHLATVKRDSVEPADVDAETPYVGLEHIDGRNLMLTRYGRASDVNSLKTRFARGDLLFGKLRPYFHKVVIAPFAGICSSDIIVFEPSEGVPLSYLALAFSETSFIDMASNAAGGTRMPRADWGYMRRQEAVRPSDKLLAAFDGATGPALERAQAAQAESRTLADLRDALLPKLISGELRIRDAERTVAAA